MAAGLAIVGFALDPRQLAKHAMDWKAMLLSFDFTFDVIAPGRSRKQVIRNR